MVHYNGGAITQTILKARFGEEIKKLSLHHGSDLTYTDLVLTLHRIFNIPTDNVIILKYKDSESDYVTLSEDADLVLALAETASASLFVEVSLDTKLFNVTKDVQQKLDKIKADVQDLLHTLVGLDSVVSNAQLEHASSKSISAATVHPLKTEEPSDVDLVKAPPSPVPSVKSELPATIHPSSQEQFYNDHSANSVEEEIPLDASVQQNESFHGQPPVVPDPHSFGLPPQNTEIVGGGIPSFPTSNAAAPPPPPVSNFHQPPPPSAPHSHFSPNSSISSTPISQNFAAPPPPGAFAPPPPLGQPQGFAPPPPSNAAPAPPSEPQQFGAPPPPQQQQFGGPSPPPQQFGAPPTPQQQQQFGAPPPPPTQPQQNPGFPSSAPTPQFGGPAGQSGVPPPPGAPQQQQQFAPPPQQFPGPQPGAFAPPPPQGQFQPPQQGFAPPPQFGQPPQQQQQQQQPGGAPPPAQGFAPPPQGQPGFAPTPHSLGGFAPPPPPGGNFVPGGNPFARGPAAPFRQSPYQQQ